GDERRRETARPAVEVVERSRPDGERVGHRGGERAVGGGQGVGAVVGDGQGAEGGHTARGLGAGGGAAAGEGAAAAERQRHRGRVGRQHTAGGVLDRHAHGRADGDAAGRAARLLQEGELGRWAVVDVDVRGGAGDVVVRGVGRREDNA